MGSSGGLLLMWGNIKWDLVEDNVQDRIDFATLKCRELGNCSDV